MGGGTCVVVMVGTLGWEGGGGAENGGREQGANRETGKTEVEEVLKYGYIKICNGF